MVKGGGGINKGEGVEEREVLQDEFGLRKGVGGVLLVITLR